MTKRLLFLILFAALCLVSSAQSVKVTKFEMRNDVVQIHYTADVPQGIKLTNFRVYANINGTSHELHNLGGDMGIVATSGSKTITWDCFKDLKTEDISGEIFFTIDCTPIGISNRYKNPKAFNMYLEYCYTPSAPVTLGMGFGGQIGAYGRLGTNTRKGNGKVTMWSVGLYVITFKWLNFNAGYNSIAVNGVSYPGYEVGATVLFGRKKWIGVNGGYIGSFQQARYGEFYVGLTLNWNTGL